MFTNYEVLLEFLEEFQSTSSCAKGTETVAISSIYFVHVCVYVSVASGSSLSKHAFDIQDIVAPVSNKDIVLLLIVTGKFAVYLMLLNLTLMISFSHDSHSEFKEESGLLSELSESQCSLLFLGSDGVLLDVHV